MDSTRIYLALTDDWELRGNGSGDVRDLQFRPLLQLADAYEKHGVRGTFMAEVMQQLAFRSNQDKHPELGVLADEWDEALCAAYRRGHDVQLHIHPQWSEAAYESGTWHLAGDWSLLNYPEHEAEQMLVACKQYLESVLRRVEPGYRCVAFRSGSSVIAPSDFALRLLSRHNIRLDISIVGGLVVNTRHVSFDYSQCDEDLVPFYPEMDDARRVSPHQQPLVCAPVFHFYASRRHVIAELIRKALRQTPTSASDDWTTVGRSSIATRVVDKIIKPVLYGKHVTADIGSMSYSLLQQMLRAIGRRAAALDIKSVPIVLTNHTKYMRDISSIERFLAAACNENISFVTLSEMERMIRSGDLPVRKAPA